MKRAGLIGLGVLATIWVLAMIILAPQFIALHKETTAVQAVFWKFGRAVVAHDYQTAYAQCSSEFREADSYQQFVAQMAELENRYGHLRTIRRDGFHVVGEGDPMRWRTTVTADFQYERKAVQLNLVFHKEGDQWLLYGFQEL